jgi:hypothetical protein
MTDLTFKEWCDGEDDAGRHRLDILLTSRVNRIFLPLLFVEVRSRLRYLVDMPQPSKMSVVEQVLYVTRRCIKSHYFFSINDVLYNLRASHPDVIEDMGKLLTRDEKNRLLTVYP